MDSASLVELAKLGFQAFLIYSTQAGLSEQQQDDLLKSVRDQFNELRKQPLPDV